MEVLTEVALTRPATGSSMVTANAARNDALIIFFMVDDPPESPL
jgi:hypothetical protein